MKKVEIVIIAAILVIISWMVCGCEKQSDTYTNSTVNRAIDNVLEIAELKAAAKKHQHQHITEQDKLDQSFEQKTAELNSIQELLLNLLGKYNAQEPNSPAVWGQGDPPVEWQGFFGNDNISRLNFVLLNRTLPGIIGRLSKLEEKIDPNAP